MIVIAAIPRGQIKTEVAARIALTRFFTLNVCHWDVTMLDPWLVEAILRPFGYFGSPKGWSVVLTCEKKIMTAKPHRSVTHPKMYIYIYYN